MPDTVRTPAAFQALLADSAAAHSTNRQLLRDLLVSIPSHAGIVHPLEPRFGGLGDGSNDDTSAIVAADTAAGVEGKDFFLPPGTYKTSSSLVVSRRWRGVPGKSIIKPTSAVAIAVDLRSSGYGDGIDIDGSNTTGKTGLDVGTAGLANILGWSRSRIHNFLGVGARGWKIATLVTGHFEDVYCDTNYINLHTNGGNTPTDSEFDNCQFRLATTKGIWIETGLGLRFYKPLMESNGEEGLYMQNVGGTGIEIGIYDPWYENNWISVASGAARHAKYHFYADGANGPAGTIRFAQENAKFSEGASDARAMHLTNATGSKDNNSKVANEAGQILVDGTSTVTFEAWNSQNGAFSSTVTSTSGGAWNSRDHIESMEGAWLAYTPTVTGSGSMTIASLVINNARYLITGKTITVVMDLVFTTGGTAGATVNVTLPTNVRSRSATVFDGAYIDDGAYKDGYIQPDGANPTSNLKFGRKDGAVWGLGNLRAINKTFTFELF